MADLLNGRGIGGVPFAADRERFVREGIPPGVFELCAARARSLRTHAFAAALAKLLRFYR